MVRFPHHCAFTGAALIFFACCLLRAGWAGAAGGAHVGNTQNIKLKEKITEANKVAAAATVCQGKLTEVSVRCTASHIAAGGEDSV